MTTLGSQSVWLEEWGKRLPERSLPVWVGLFNKKYDDMGNIVSCDEISLGAGYKRARLTPGEINFDLKELNTEIRVDAFAFFDTEYGGRQSKIIPLVASQYIRPGETAMFAEGGIIIDLDELLEP